MTQPETPPKPRAPRQRTKQRPAATKPLPAGSVARAITAALERLTLERDPDTSMVESLRLHMVSEHGVLDAITADDEDDVRTHHEALHREPVGHQLADLRFRPGAGRNALAERAAREESVRRLLVADVTFSSHHRPT